MLNGMAAAPEKTTTPNPNQRSCRQWWLEMAANREAVSYLEQALGALGDLPDRRDVTELAIDLRFDLRTALVPLADWERMQEHLRAAETLATALGDQRRLARVSIYMVIQSVLAQEYEEAGDVGYGGEHHPAGDCRVDLHGAQGRRQQAARDPGHQKVDDHGGGDDGTRPCAGC